MGPPFLSPLSEWMLRAALMALGSFQKELLRVVVHVMLRTPPQTVPSLQGQGLVLFSVTDASNARAVPSLSYST